jgi:hypothetical protein
MHGRMNGLLPYKFYKKEKKEETNEKKKGFKEVI